jgi:16S rRNA (cytidine1402-2'-O)-methyltransferase
MPSGTLYLIPVTLGGDDLKRIIPEFNSELIKGLTYFIGENAKATRAFLKLSSYPNISNALVEELNQHTKNTDLRPLLQPLLNGHNVGLMSDAGCPGIADPGAEIVRQAHRQNIKVVPLIGPSSITLSIMASGFNGQHFAFVGYLPIEKTQRSKRLKELEKISQQYNQSQFFIETPYRNGNLFSDCLSALNPDTLLSLAVNITLPDEYICTKSVGEWKQSETPDFNKKPTVFGIYVG